MEVAAAAVGWKLDTTGVSIKNLEEGSDGRVAAVTLEDGSTLEADVVKGPSGYIPHVKAWSAVVGRLASAPYDGHVEAVRLFKSIISET
ncbi:hypothetical protein LINGRAHAP2_LOCUS22773 [Linum grandiflorum]